MNTQSQPNKEQLDFSHIEVKRAFRKFINLKMNEQHLRHDHLAKCCDMRTVERYFKGPESAMPKRLPENRVYEFLDTVNSQYNDFYQYYQAIKEKESKVSSLSLTQYLTSLPKKGLIWGVVFAVTILAMVMATKLTNTVSHQPFITTFQAISPVDQTLCKKDLPFRSGIKKLDNNPSLKSGECFAITLSWNGHGELFLLLQSNGTLLRLLPDDCNAIGYKGTNLGAGEWHFPLNDDGTATMFELDNRTGKEVIIALAVESKLINPIQRETLSNLPTLCSDALDDDQITTLQQLNALGSHRWEQDQHWWRITILHQ